MPKLFIVKPRISDDITIGTEGNLSRLYIGKLAENGPSRKIQFGASREFVALIVGKRGSGKSYTLGALVESLATREDETSISFHRKRYATLLLDPMGNYWTTLHQVRSNGPEKVRRQFSSLDGWDCGESEADGYRRASHFEAILEGQPVQPWPLH